MSTITEQFLAGQTVESASDTIGYSPTYGSEPFLDFESVTPATDLESLNLNWREADLPQRLRTKHVHSLHPYLGKFIPQIAEIFLRKFEPTTVCDPFSGSGTTLVEAATLGINAIGCDISAFNNLVSHVKTGRYDMDLLDYEARDILNRTLNTGQLRLAEPQTPYHPNEYLTSWYAPDALQALLVYERLIGEYEYSDVLRVILSRAARSARLTTHYDLDFPKKPQMDPYQCYKHGRICTPTQSATQFLQRYSTDTVRRVGQFAELRKNVALSIITGDTRTAEFPRFDLVITSPPYVGLIDYHEQHRYSYELLGLPWEADKEIGAAASGTSIRARNAYVTAMTQSFNNVRSGLARDGRVVVVVNDKLGLYDSIMEQAGFQLETRLERHVNRRTGRRAGDFFESILIWRQAN